METTYELAGGLNPSGKVRFTYDETQSVGPHYGNIRVTLRNGRTYVVNGRHQQLLRVL